MSEEQRRKARRTRTGCLTCRARKVKCDEHPGVCKNCERVVLECKWPEARDVVGQQARSRGLKREATALSEDGHGSSSPKKRGPACTACRVARCRCSQTRPACVRCIENGISCSYDAESNAHTVAFDVTPSSAGRSPGLPHANQKNGKPKAEPYSSILSRPIIDLHLDAFFNYVYPIQANAFLHPGTLRRDVQSGHVDRRLLLSLCAVSSRFVPSPPSEHATYSPESWAREAKTLLILDTDISIDSVASALLLAKYDINSGRYTSAWILSSMANRTALALGLHRETEDEDDMPFIERETRRRLYWGCYALDRIMSTGAPEFVSTHAKYIKLRLPCEEHQYLLGMPVTTLIPHLEVAGPYDATPQPEVGMMGNYVRLTAIRFVSLNYTRHREDVYAPFQPWESGSTFSFCANKLLAWRQSLLPQFHLVPDTIYARQSQSDISPLFMLHIWYDQAMSELCRIALPGFAESLTDPSPEHWLNQTRTACVDHAKGVARTLRLLVQHTGESYVFLDPSLSICVYECMRVRVTDFFMSSQYDQPGILIEMTEDFILMMGVVDRMKKYFRQAEWLHKEMRRLLRRHGITLRAGSEQSSMSDNSAPGTPHHPWQKRIRGIREQDRQAINAAQTLQEQAETTYVDAFDPLAQLAWDGATDINGLFGPPQPSVGDSSNVFGMFGDWMAAGYIPMPEGGISGH